MEEMQEEKLSKGGKKPAASFQMLMMDDDDDMVDKSQVGPKINVFSYPTYPLNTRGCW